MGETNNIFSTSVAKILVFIVIVAFSLKVNAQKKDKTVKLQDEKIKLESEADTQGELEIIWSEKLFKEHYIRQHYPKFKGVISKYGDSILFDRDLVEVDDSTGKMQLIFETGIFYPGIISGELNTSKKPLHVDQYKNSPALLFIRTDSLMVSGFDEIKVSNGNIKSKRFRFLLWRKGLMNPSVCFIELTNNKAKASADFKTFVGHAKLTFFEEGWIGI
ncbi:hypothetical protein [Pedobacter frigoris]|uniref:hypothetical protein n=1 Tax=Pedobacter frigoris TaxID=2571272 RepID=UPI00292D6B66|nr:hypothetical protein [Pedobacter frigoris]